MTDFEFQTCCYLDDMAKAGNWTKVLEILRNPDLKGVANVNQSRPGSASRSSVLHHAAENGAPADVIQELLQHGALPSLRNSDKRTAYDIARGEATPVVIDLLEPVPSPLSNERQSVLAANLAEVIDTWFQPFAGNKRPSQLLRCPPVEALHEAPGQELWLQFPNLTGGLRVILQRGYLELLVGYRSFPEEGVHVTVNGFVITHVGSALVYESSGITAHKGEA